MHQLISLLFFPLFFSQTARSLIMTVGEVKKMPASATLWVENGSVISAADLGTHFQIKALQPGESEIKTANQTLHAQVLTLKQSRTFQMLQKVLPQTLNLRVQIHQAHVQVLGRLVRWKDYQKIVNACLMLACEYQFAATMSEPLWKEVLSQIQADLKSNSLPLLRVEKNVGLKTRMAKSSALFQPTSELLSRYGISVVADPTLVDIAPLVRVHITVAEIKKNWLLKYGINWPSALSAQVLPSVQWDQVKLALQAVEQNGFGQVLATPNILCRSGKEAEFIAGGEFPIKIVNYRTQDVIWKKYGVLLKIAPLADFSGRMSIALTTEVSNLDNDRKVDDIPGIFTNRMQSHFDLIDSRTIVLSGLVKSENSRSRMGLPGLKDLPILGLLFGSKDFVENKSELVIFVKPEIFDPETIDPLLKTLENFQ